MTEHLEAIAVHAYYAGELAAGRRACERLLRGNLPPDRERIVRRNRTWYTEPLRELMTGRFVRLDVPPAAEGWSLFNPSIVLHADGWLANIRSSNYRIVDGRYVIPPEDGERIRTVNLLVDLADDLTPANCLPLAGDYQATAYPVEGLEDVRLNVVAGELLASATVRNMAPHDGTCRIATATVDGGAFRDLRCHGTPPGRHEKNWMPLVGRRQWLYSCFDSGYVSTATDDGDCWSIQRHSHAPAVARGFRGGSQLVEAAAGVWLAIVHEVAEDRGRRIYEHRFVEFHEAVDGWRLVSVSPPFVFRERRSIEFCAGLAIKGLRLVATFGVRDAEAWAVELPLADVWRVMEPV